MSLRNTDALFVETSSAANSLPDPTTVNGRTHILVNTGTATVTWSSTGATPFTENGNNVATITISRGQLKMLQSDGVHWIVSPGGQIVAPTIQSAQHSNLGTFTMLAAAHAATAGFVWLVNPVGSSVLLDVRKVWLNFGPGATAILTPPTSLNIERMSFTGTPSGATIAPAARDTSNPAAVGSIRTASTGMAITAGNVIHAFTAQQMVGTLGLNLTNSIPVDQTWPGDVDTNDHLVLRPGEGIVVRQATAGAAVGENRTARVDIIWDERLP